ncbi:MAG: NAD(P)/FAD-dependent oxidoreductase [Cyanobacteria bacterium SZAS LIN-5]|nr:NAD(P)/FAD-dependent oxidoreductase [Cyanobacteria bacterium SZAS LIN-5]
MDSLETIIIGAGPAGLSCALELQDCKISYIVFEKSGRVGGQLWDMKSSVRNFVGGYSPGGELTAQRLVDLADVMKANVKFNANVEQVDLKLKTVVVNGHRHKAKYIVIATGCRLKELPLPGTSIFSDSVFYRTAGKEAEFAGKKVAVIGGGDSALIQCLELSQRSPQVHLIHRTSKLKARPDLVTAVRSNPKINLLLETEVDSLIGQKRLAGLQVISSRSGEVRDIEAECLLIKIGYMPNTEPFRGQVNMDSSGHIFIDQNCQTNVPGVFAVGDLTNPGYPRIAVAAGHGTMAAAHIRTLFEGSVKKLNR